MKCRSAIFFSILLRLPLYEICELTHNYFAKNATQALIP